MKKYLKYIITFSIGAIVALIIMFSKGIQDKTALKDIMHILSDSFIVPGVCITGYGLLIVAANGGTFDMLVYGFSKFFNMFRHDMSRERHKTFYEYRLAKSDRPKTEFWYLVFIGLFFIAVALVFLIFYF